MKKVRELYSRDILSRQIKAGRKGIKTSVNMSATLESKSRQILTCYLFYLSLDFLKSSKAFSKTFAIHSNVTTKPNKFALDMISWIFLSTRNSCGCK